MAETELIAKEKIEHSGIFDFSAFYGYLNSWLKDEGYSNSETKYSESIKDNARDISSEWRATKSVSDYFKFMIKIEISAKELVEVEVEINGDKKQTNRGKLSIGIEAFMIKDPESKWETSPFSRFMRDIYNKYIIPSRVESMRDKLSADIVDFKEEIKALLELVGKR